MPPLFANRTEAGRLLAAELGAYADRPSTVVLGIPRGGVVTAFEVAQALRLPLDMFVVRKLGTPGQEELAMGAVAGGGFYLLNQEIVESLHIPEEQIQTVLRKEQKELRRRERLYRQGREPLPVRGRTVILVDDGIATGSSLRAAIQMLRAQHPARIVIGVPVAPIETCEALKKEVHEVVCVRTPHPFHAIGCWYEDFTPTSDEEVCDLLRRASTRRLSSAV